MCGILGFISQDKDQTIYNNPRLDVLKDGLTTGHVRGAHGTGLFYVPRTSKEVISYKKPISGPDFSDLRWVDKNLKGIAEASFVVAHHRRATIGSHTIENTHPFTHGKITLVHNGEITNTAALYKGAYIHFAVDSEYIAYALSLVDDPKEVLTKIQGAYTLVWYNSETDCLYWARNDQRPFHFAFKDEGDTIYFASEYYHLQWITKRNGVDIPDKNYKSLNPGWVVTIPKKDPTKYATEKFEPYKAPTYNDYNRGGYRHPKPNGGGGSKTNSVISLTKDTASYDNFFKIMPNFKVGMRVPFYVTTWQENAASRKVNPKGQLLGIHKEGVGVICSGVRKRVVDNHEIGYFSGIVEMWQVAFNNATHGQKYELVIKRGSLKEEYLSGDEDEDDLEDFDFNTDYSPVFLKGPGNTLLTRPEWDKEVAHGCIYCADPIDIKDHLEVLWDQFGPICPSCKLGNVGKLLQLPYQKPN